MVPRPATTLDRRLSTVTALPFTTLPCSSLPPSPSLRSPPSPSPPPQYNLNEYLNERDGAQLVPMEDLLARLEAIAYLEGVASWVAEVDAVYKDLFGVSMITDVKESAGGVGENRPPQDPPPPPRPPSPLNRTHLP